MPEMLITDVPEDVLEAVDAHARRLGLSLSEYVSRLLEQDAQRRSATATTVDDLRRISRALAELDDPEVMRQAWT